ncbi:hypothetical protein [Absidia glauca]|uniref:RING-type domain-containing protein n=1 Tax=Absidia glauca TaxID=4829 RepID=A0A163JAD1_ABSGL|nr:hypothetical protein [Absidia glauca]
MLLFDGWLLWLWVLCLLHTVTRAQSPSNPVFWQVPIVYNTSEPLDQGSMVNGESRLAVSQDFQVVNPGDDGSYEHKRLLVDMSDGCSNKTNLSTIQQWNDKTLTTSVIRSLPKIALIERGGCSWNRKLTAVNYLSSLYRLNIEALMIYDNDTHGISTSFALQPVGSTEAQKPGSYSSPLPYDRNVSSMGDNDISRDGSSVSSNGSNSAHPSVYFTTKDYGLYLKKLNHTYPSQVANNGQPSYLQQYYQITLFLSDSPWQSTDTSKDGNDDGGSGFSSLLASSRGYLSYIIALVAVFLIGVIFLRWWKLRKMRRRISARNEQVVYSDYILRSRVNQIDPLPVNLVNALPIIYYTADRVKNGNCAICLDDYVENKSQLRKNDWKVKKCQQRLIVPYPLDPWLTQKSTFCPICKFDCLPSDQRRERQLHCQQEQLQQPQSSHQPADRRSSSISMGTAVPRPSSTVYSRSNVQQPTSTTTVSSIDNEHPDTTRPTDPQNGGQPPTGEERSSHGSTSHTPRS